MGSDCLENTTNHYGIDMQTKNTIDAMQWTVNNMITQHTPGVKVTQEQYRQWAAGFVFEGLRNQRYGQSFCRHFGITDNILFYAGTVSEADQYIRENYIE